MPLQSNPFSYGQRSWRTARGIQDDLGLQQADLLEEFGNKTTASQIMRRQRHLTLPIIRRLATRLNLPVAVLAQDYKLKVIAPAGRMSATG
jgi:hypothetical protein